MGSVRMHISRSFLPPLTRPLTAVVMQVKWGPIVKLFGPFICSLDIVLYVYDCFQSTSDLLIPCCSWFMSVQNYHIWPSPYVVGSCHHSTTDFNVFCSSWGAILQNRWQISVFHSSKTLWRSLFSLCGKPHTTTTTSGHHYWPMGPLLTQFEACAGMMNPAEGKYACNRFVSNLPDVTAGSSWVVHFCVGLFVL